ncbi:RagB/SusD family nutrient uptake outer membrane protein [Proteiniphilum sp. X52]|uniref:RagB/SusD family nutrient uptake outer membrane protein n=1 Tax=Proteiniphilum sp. X52 TaxID=2382159 RepID=UPI000F0A5799|nr:RagB/SusD family nutrient uptake outer membrane protein [Proteiniphilum sp. X52]RNC63328.1 RagB/SusD family nutrient uptake outer membrane protein [Proteiniphilum sp. X52]
MKKIYLLSILFAGILIASCSKDTLKLENPNEPGLEVLGVESEMQKAALGVYNPLRIYYFMWFVQADHNVMGDALSIPHGNFGWRWVNQVSSITRSNGQVITPPEGSSQPEMLRSRNSRDYGSSDNTFAHEWFPNYGVIGHANLMMSKLDDVNFTGTEAEIAVKKNTFKIWFLWWKGFAYSRIGSIYSQGTISDIYSEAGRYVSHAEIIAEANRNFEEAKTLLAGINEDDTSYRTLMTSFIPSPFRAKHGGFISPRMLERNINSYLARNILVNKYAEDLTSAELTEIETLASNGIREDDKIFNVITDPNSDLCFVYQTAWAPYRLLAGWEFVSERLVQDFKEGDARYTRNIKERASAYTNARGMSYGTRYDVISNGDYASLDAGVAEMPMACTYEETQLMLAEAKIRKDQIDAGLAHIDAIRTYQNAELAAVSGTGLNKAAALEELRKERRIGLFLKGTAFYDARRWGILKPVSEGGGRTNANFLFVNTSVTPATVTLEQGTIDYNYMEWWDVPADETDFNPIEMPGIKD